MMVLPNMDDISFKGRAVEAKAGAKKQSQASDEQQTEVKSTPTLSDSGERSTKTPIHQHY